MKALVRWLSLLVLVAACATKPPVLELNEPIVLLGEVHDNAEQHALRLRALQHLLAGGARPAIVMEQFDRDQQAAIDARRSASPPPSAADIVRAGDGSSGWHWPYYEPYIDLALRYGLPVVAANVGREEARRVMQDGLAAHGFDAAVPADIIDALAAQIVEGHCGQIKIDQARRMALAQVARDQAMARAIEANAARGVVLLAGNGHVRTDVGVPRWLPPALRAHSEAIGVLETGDPTPAFDRRVFTPAQARDDPCAALRPGSRQSSGLS